MSATAPSIGWRDLMRFFSPAGQMEISQFIEQAKAERGAGWLTEIKADYPMFCWIAELVCNHDANDAFEHFQAAYKGLPLRYIRPQMIELHRWLRTEIEKPRG